jgi:hypothetical protein
MFQYSCTRVARKLRRLGVAKKAAARFAKIFRIMMAILGGLMGLVFEIPEELFEPIAISGKNPAGTRNSLFLPAVSLERR